ncbi:asparagine synthase (glutamine-hydrolyzing) [Marinobacter sp. SS5-14b]|uniref:asparagine synthase (glutamine-hydrolyzing) n=1 Tax=Marinobacter sp. SS5-14b TaxID=3050456 RepID=UPI0026DFAC4D|nr:asparagine synthase (glutamine-hydrolyzing) [Marinobacter sp. SS5-14b]
MCGIAGFVYGESSGRSTIQSMCDQISHRGPDSEGYWQTDDGALAIGHRRLSILDLSAAGHQPMHSECGRYVLVFNGEIYNHLALRSLLAEPNWRGQSDTETLLACFTAWGLEATLQVVRGMFAFALWDKQEQELTLARDRMGEKPLYWGWCGDVLLFGSELKALKAHPAFNAEVDRDALTLLLRHCYIPAPYSIYQGIQKLRPGHFVRIPVRGDVAESKAADPVAYWSLTDVVENGQSNKFCGSPSEAVGLLESSLSASVSEQMLSDVPLGAFLSGGVDSSAIVALMQAQSNRKVKTFTIGFEEGGYNEAEHAKQVARHLGTDHTELYVSADDALGVIPSLPTMFCEPFGDSSQIPTFLVSQMAKQHVTVALSGDGGDELFGGYNRYMAAQKVWGPVQRLPAFVRKFGAASLRAMTPAQWDRLFQTLSPILPKRARLSIPGEKARKLADVLSLTDGHAFYRQLTSHWNDPASVVINGNEPETLISNSSAWPKTDSLEHAMMAMDAQTYMADDILVKVDRAAMATSLETRVPMLNHQVVELAWQMPLEYKIRDGQGKWLLRQVLYKHVPRELIERPKAGFGIPLDAWLRGPLREWAESLLSEQRLRSEGFFHPEPIRTMWAQHLSGKMNWQYHLWNVLMFQAWFAEQ